MALKSVNLKCCHEQCLILLPIIPQQRDPKNQYNTSQAALWDKHILWF